MSRRAIPPRCAFARDRHHDDYRFGPPPPDPSMLIAVGVALASLLLLALS